MSMNPVDNSRRRLGRGLTALLGGSAPASTTIDSADESEMRMIAVDNITRNPWQPRKDFDAESLGELADSIREHGLLQPVLVREYAGSMQLIAGERRWRAAQKAGLTSIPCRVVDVIDKTACEFALEENLKRKDLSDLEKAQAFKDYVQQFECSIEELSKQLSMSRSAVSNLMRLLDLTEPVQNALRSGRISTGHARALLPLDAAGQLELCGRIQAETLTVRQTESAVRELLGREKRTQATSEAAPMTTVSTLEVSAPEVTASSTDGNGQDIQHSDSAVSSGGEPQQFVSHHEGTPSHESGDAPTWEASTGEDHTGETADTIPMVSAQNQHLTNHVRDLQEQLRGLLGTMVDIRLTGKETGQIVIPFHNNGEFERVLGILRSRAA
ncbi:MAG: ParB/RepB/Spo0J family partition protein [Planctomycetaceae bacterium]